MDASPYSFHFMQFMPYTALPKEHADPHQYPSTLVEMPNRLYDPAKGKALYERYIGEFVLADRLGYDGVVVNEHHSTAYSMMPAPNPPAKSVMTRSVKAGFTRAMVD